jgi:hypothetical protein
MDVLQIYVVTDDVPDMMTRIHVVPRKEKNFTGGLQGA